MGSLHEGQTVSMGSLSGGYTKGGETLGRKRYTKRELIKLYYEGRLPMSPEIGTEVREGADDVKLNTPYEVVNVEDVSTDVAQYKGVRVEFLDTKGKTGTVML